MKGKKVLKVLMATMVIVTMLAQVAVFAEGAQYFTTSTEYDLALGKAKVTSSVFGIDDGEEITILVERGAEILYIDQVNKDDATSVAGSSATFTYLIDAEDADGSAEVKFASTNNASSAVTPNSETDGTIKLGNVTVNFNSAYGDVFVGSSTAEVEASSQTTVRAGTILDFYVAPKNGYVYTGYATNDGRTVTGGANADGKISVIIDETTTAITIAFEAVVATTDSVSVSAVTSTAGKATNEAGVEVNTAQTFATISMAGVTEFGVEFAAKEDKSDKQKYAAAGHIEGKYGVRLVDANNDYAGETVYVRPYAIYDTEGESGKEAYGDWASVNFD